MAHFEKEMNVDVIIGHILISHVDRWQGRMWLQNDGTFQNSADTAVRVYLLKSGNTAILNGDRIGIHSGHKTVVLDGSTLKLLDRDLIDSKMQDTFIITDGSDNTDPIAYDVPLMFITDIESQHAWKYGRSTNGASLVIAPLDAETKSAFQFYLGSEPRPAPIEPTPVETTETPYSTMTRGPLEGYRGMIIVALLLILLVLCMVLNVH